MGNSKVQSNSRALQLHVLAVAGNAVTTTVSTETTGGAFPFVLLSSFLFSTFSGIKFCAEATKLLRMRL